MDPPPPLQQQQDASEDVTDFLRRIKELEHRREREDTERTKKLEQDILQGRKLREARRAERARSLSPEKSSPATTPRSAQPSHASQRAELTSSPSNPAHLPTPSLTSTTASQLGRATPEPQKPSSRPQAFSPSPEPLLDSLNSPNDMPAAIQNVDAPPLPARPGALSWQQRTSSPLVSRSMSVRSRPAPPTVSSSPNGQPSRRETEQSGHAALSRAQIAQNLASKDPAWFRQTQDLGKGSAAFRRNVQDTAEPAETSDLVKRPLHGLSPKQSADVYSSLPRSLSPPATSRQSPPGSERAEEGDFPSSSSPRTVPKPKDLSSDATSFVVPQTPSLRPTSTSNLDFQPQSFDRPPSPTKGLGGFVHSAMLKRSESISKRWSAQPSSNHSKPSPAPLTSNSDALDINSQTKWSETGLNTGNAETIETEPIPQKATLPSELDSTQSARPRTPVSLIDTNNARPSDTATPSSPSKRWSPSKSTWLESALNKPESPAPKYAQPPPAWMSQLAKSKQDRIDKDHSLPKPRPASYIEPRVTQSEGLLDPTTALPPAPKPKPPSLVASDVAVHANTVVPRSDSEALRPKPQKPATPKPATTPKNDFRSQLRTVDSQSSKSANEELEFRSAFGKLKRTQTERYVAPDELKNNILRGKAALSVTGGPQPSTRKDELKESLIKQRETMKAKANDPDAQAIQLAPKPAEIVPEAIAKKKLLEKNNYGPSSVLSSTPQIETPHTLVEKSPVLSRTSHPKPSVSARENAPNFNTSLASIIARGPRQFDAENTVAPALPAGNQARQMGSQPISDTGQLQHMTKGRARGPKRRLPNAQATSQTASSLQKQPLIVQSPQISSRAGLEAVEQEGPKQTSLSGLPSEDARQDNHKPEPPAKSTWLNEVGQKRTASANSGMSSSATRPLISTKPKSVREIAPDVGVPLERSPNAPNVARTQGLQQNTELLQESPAHSPKISPGKVMKVWAQDEPSQAQKPLHNASSSRVNSSFSISSSKPLKVEEPYSQVDTRSSPLTTSSSDPENIFTEFFGKIPRALVNLDIDTNTIALSKPPAGSKNQTLRKQVSKLGGDGKLLPILQHEEYIFFGSCMYLCTHEFANSQNSKEIEVYLWIGAAVGEAAQEDAQLFARKAAKDAGGSFFLFRQGKEPAIFFQAIGGILVTRSGSAEEKPHPYMVCGRKHLGHLAFDEVPLSTSSLCSGFPYIISGTSSIYLWKGSGCSIEELAAARLLSMDIGSTGEVLEIDEGKEPSEFFALFPPGEQGRPRSAEHWKLKSAHENYCNRLFQVDYSERPISRQDSGSTGIWNLVRQRSQPDLQSFSQTQIREISPFIQSDLKSENIYLLDAFFELYIILGPRSNRKPEAFAAALVFAQEYAILSASADNRPHVPVATVVVEGAPKDMKRVFRYWEDAAMPSGVGNGKGAMKRGRSLRIMPLSRALAALQS